MKIKLNKFEPLKGGEISVSGTITKEMVELQGGKMKVIQDLAVLLGGEIVTVSLITDDNPDIEVNKLDIIKSGIESILLAVQREIRPQEGIIQPSLEEYFEYGPEAPEESEVFEPEAEESESDETYEPDNDSELAGMK